MRGPALKTAQFGNVREVEASLSRLQVDVIDLYPGKTSPRSPASDRQARPGRCRKPALSA
jgi:hypothetical protein